MTEIEKMTETGSANYSMSIVRQRDIDRYLATLFLPANIRPHVYGLYAFDAEIAHIRDMIKEPMMGEIRLQWWRDIISGERAGEAANNPVAEQLLATINAYELPVMGFDNYLKARAFDFYNDPMPDMGSFEGYAGETASFLFYQVATILGNDSSLAVRGLADCAGHAGVVWTLLQTLKSLPSHRARHQCYIPTDVLDEVGMSHDAYFDADNIKQKDALVEVVLSKLHHHRKKFTKNIANIDTELKLTFLPLCLLPLYIGCFEKSAGEALITPVDIPQWRKQICIWRSARNGKF